MGNHTQRYVYILTYMLIKIKHFIDSLFTLPTKGFILTSHLQCEAKRK